jgi:hypothetical protein
MGQQMYALPRPLREKVPSIQPLVEQVVLTALAKDSKDRFASVRAFANAFEHAIPPPRTGAFISYSHKDKEHLDQLHAYLELYQQGGAIDVWDDTRIQPGTKWREQIKQALDAAKVAVLLISVDILRSKFIKENELPPLIKAALEEGITILLIILDPCPFEEFGELAQLQTINPPSKPVIGMTAFEKKELWNGVAKRIRDALKA